MTLDRLKNLSAQVARELVFAEANSDSGVLPLNSLIGEIEELVAGHGEWEQLKSHVAVAREAMNRVLEADAIFSQEDLTSLGVWVTQWQDLLFAQESHPPHQAAQDTAADRFEAGAGACGTPEATVAEEIKPSPASRPAKESSIALSQVDLGHANQAGELAEPLSTEEPLLHLNLPEDRELLTEFLSEAEEHWHNIEQGVLVLERDPSNAETLNAIFRSFHTFKGGAGFLNLMPVQKLAHELESLLELARNNQLQMTPGIINLILEGGDTLNGFAKAIRERMSGEAEAEPILVPTLALLGRIREVLANPTSGLPSAAADIAPASATTLPSPHEAAAMETASAPGSQASNGTALAENRGTTIPLSLAAMTVKVDTQKLDSLVDQVGEMVIAQSLVIQNPLLKSSQNEQLARDLGQLERITHELQRTAMSLRMVPIRTTFQKMNRLVRDLAASVGKQVKLVTEGEDTELDRTLVEELSDPLVHMIRNSVDHGIEHPELRSERGKPAQGTILLRAYHQGGNIVVEVKDDGKGLDPEVLRNRGIQLGVVRPDEQLTEEEILNLVMLPGFSTAERVTDLSGRGVGMDVVRRNIEKLRGKIEIQSRVNQGVTFRVFLPLTLAIIDGLLVGVGEHCYVLPTLLVRESFRPTAEMVVSVAGRGEMVNVRGRLRPLLRLYSQLGVTPRSNEVTESIVLVLEAGNQTRCVLVDRLIGKQEVVIKSLGEIFRDNHYLAGAAILGDGRIGLILDPYALVNLDKSPERRAA